MNSWLKARLERAFPRATVTATGETEYLVAADKENALSILAYLKDAGFDHLALVSCVDWIEEQEFEIVYVLSPYMKDNAILTGEEKVTVIVKARIPRDNPEIQTSTHIFENAEPYERELHELFGIRFRGHKRLIPLFLEREYKIPPFRKDFDTRKYVEKTFGAIPAVED
ncbi:MAG: NADH-quinone oxidoreductase subunit C [Chitinispirillaceae bacterium]|nr:NADH-quinone oxidoreductase subunit C [Chitinispirillaceae bacterium]